MSFLFSPQMSSQKIHKFYIYKVVKNTTSHQSEWPSQTNQQTTSVERMRRKGNPSALLVGMLTGEATVENSTEFPQKTKNGNAL